MRIKRSDCSERHGRRTRDEDAKYADGERTKTWNPYDVGDLPEYPIRQNAEIGPHNNGQAIRYCDAVDASALRGFVAAQTFLTKSQFFKVLCSERSRKVIALQYVTSQLAQDLDAFLRFDTFGDNLKVQAFA